MCEPPFLHLCLRTDLVTETKGVENYPDFEKKVAHLIEHGLQGV